MQSAYNEEAGNSARLRRLEADLAAATARAEEAEARKKAAQLDAEAASREREACLVERRKLESRVALLEAEVWCY